ncbi:MAG: glyoxalase [Flavobacteriaceae bacterium]|nr:glyoxalase [Flavobacteriaceae bacterium]OUX40448.1 MAG: glyoxalase [Flavobacteriaceae bacterium TMED265]
MIDRDERLQRQRPDLPVSKIKDNMSSEEYFQNAVLRPILKFQNDILIEVFKTYIQKRKNVYYTLNTNQKLNYVAHSIQKDIKFRNQLKGMIVGLFSLEEYELYIKNSSALNKRMMNLMIQRIQNQLQLLEGVTSLEQ